MYTLIIVDDEREINNGFARYFPWASLGFTVAGQFSHGREALEYLDGHDVDVIISDMRMPEMDGIELAKRLAERNAGIRPMLVIFSAYGEFQYAQQAMQYGAVRYILKSTPYEELIEEFQEIRRKLDESSGKKEQEREEEGRGLTLNLLLDYIEKHIDDVTLEKLAEEVYLSPAYVSRYFKQKTGQNFQDYLIERRMKLAAELLENTKYRVGDVSDLVGYSNPFNFTRTFKKYYGMTPKDYRKEGLGRAGSGKDRGKE